MKMTDVNTIKIERYLPEDDELYLKAVFDTEIIVNALEEHNPDLSGKILSCKTGNVRYNPGVSCIISYLVSYKNDDSNDEIREAMIYVKCYDESKFKQIARATTKKIWVSGDICPSPLILSDFHAVINEFPNDARIPGLSLIANINDLWKVMSTNGNRIFPEGWAADKESTVSYKLRYKPENRYVARCDTLLLNDKKHERKAFRVLLRIEKSRATGATFEFMQRFHMAIAREKHIGIPKPLFYSPEYNVQVHEWIEASRFSELLRSEEAVQHTVSLAEALSSIHKYQDHSLAILDLTEYSRRIKKVSLFLSCAGDEIERQSAEICVKLLKLIKTPPFGQFGLVHGDFHQGQVLCEKDRNVFLDFAKVSNGESVSDVGNFLAQMKFMKLRGRLQNDQNLDLEFLDSYKRSSGAVFPDQRLKFWIAISLLELAAREFRRLKPGWPKMAGRLLKECRSSLNG